VDGPIGPIACADSAARKCPMFGSCVFLGVWERARTAMENVYDGTTIGELLSEDRRLQERHPAVHYSI
jgi:DNA-binding IscR family transcriptional regulator